MLFPWEGCTNSGLGSSTSVRDGGPFVCACLAGSEFCATVQDPETPVNLFTYLTVQVTRRDAFLQDELRKSLASLLADWGRVQALQHNERETAQVPNLNSPDKL